MTKENFALMSVLYDNEEANLYSDIYFPIIKYSIANLYNDQMEGGKYYDLSLLQDNIFKQFGIKIPLIVLKQAIKAVQKLNKEVSITIISNGNNFRINKAWDVHISESIEAKLDNTTDKFNELEDKFQEYLRHEQIETDKTLLDLFSDNSNEIYRFLNELDSTPIIDEEYIHLVSFLLALKQTNKELFNIVNNIFWGSIISAFLKRDVDLNIKPNNIVRYYLDTSLILSILDLDSEENVTYSNELLQAIISSGSLPYVHPLTLREVENILSSVERDAGPITNSPIESAYYRRNLSPSKILRIKNNLNNSVEELNIIIETCSDRDLDEISKKYKRNTYVKSLKEFRGGHTSASKDNIRDIHDIFMHDFIQKKRGNIFSTEKINSYFVSLNSSLINFLRTEKSSNSLPSIIHPSKIISTLWIHNSSCSLVKNNGLTEIMSRCFALNNSDVQRKLKVIMRYFNEEDILEEDYKNLYFALVDRSNKMLEEVARIEEDEIENKEPNEKEKQERKNLLLDIARTENQRKKDTTLYNNLEKENLSLSIINKHSTNEELSIKYNNLKSHREQEKTEFESIIKELESDIKTEQDKRNRVANIGIEMEKLKEEKVFLDKDKTKSISMCKYWLVISLELICIIALLVGVVLLVFSLFQNNENNLPIKTISPALIITTAIPFLSLIFRITKLYLFSPKITYKKLKDEQINHWIEENQEYTNIINKINSLQQERDSIILN